VDGETDTSALERAAVSAGFRPQAAEIVISGLCAKCAARS
jgi:hypothetical protein